MNFDADYIRSRHNHWIVAIGQKGIWNMHAFAPVTIIVKPRSKTCNGKFRRKTAIVNGRVAIDDAIIIYRNSPDRSAAEIDNVLVHEMIHQYIYQAHLTDTSSHGRIFRSMMAGINKAFAGQLNITISTKADMSAHGPGRQTHLLVVLHSVEWVYCCAICRSSVRQIAQYLKRYRTAMKISAVEWYVSNDVHFDSFSKCRSRLHGERVDPGELNLYCEKYGLRKLQS